MYRPEWRIKECRRAGILWPTVSAYRRIGACPVRAPLCPVELFACRLFHFVSFFGGLGGHMWPLPPTRADKHCARLIGFGGREDQRPRDQGSKEVWGGGSDLNTFLNASQAHVSNLWSAQPREALRVFLEAPGKPTPTRP